MSFQIKKIVLYNADGKIRSINFQGNSVNIITGASGTGKSSIIPIVEYCLGSRSSNIPLKHDILNKISWFGIHLFNTDDELFVVRKNPESGNISSESIYFEKGKNLEIPPVEKISPTINLEGLKAILTTFAGIGDYSFKPKEGQTRKPGLGDIRKALIYCFQKQGEVGNQDLLFHRQGEQTLPQSIKDYMPFFMGAVNKDYVSGKEELNRAKTELLRLQSQDAEKNRIKGSAFERAHALIAESISVGLLQQTQEMPQSWSSVRNVIESALNYTPKHDVPDKAEYVNKLEQLFTERHELSRLHSIISDEVFALQALKSGNDGFAQEATEQQARLKSIGLIPIVKNDQIHICPFCESEIKNKIPTSNNLISALKGITNHLDGVRTDLPHIQKLIASAQNRQNDIQRKINDVNSQIFAIQRIDKQIEKIRDIDTRIALMKGRLGLYLESIQDIKDEDIENQAVINLKNKISELEKILDIEETQNRLDSILRFISKEMSEMARVLNLEYSKYQIRMDPKKLTVVADTECGEVPMTRMGSAHTWMSLHVITHLALHKWFAQNNLPVPHFLFLDQPSQAYFPPDVKDITIKDTDSESVHHLFKFISEKTKDAGFQIIILEHADIQQPWYQSMVREKWWDAKTKLVPESWITSSK